MKKITMGFYALAASSLLASTEPVETIIKRSVIGNAAADSTTLGVDAPNIAFGQTGISSLNSFSAAMQFEFRVGGVPVNVTDFNVSTATYTLTNSGSSTAWTNLPHGAYNPAGDGSRPDLITYNAAGVKTSVDGVQVIGANIIPVVSKVQVLDQVVTLGIARPKLTAAGQYYKLERSWTFTYKYGGNSYSHTITPSQSAVTVTVYDDIPGFTPGELPGPFPISTRLQVSQDLSNWVTFPSTEIFVPYPAPALTVGEMTALFPSSSLHPPEITLSTPRFYRFIMEE